MIPLNEDDILKMLKNSNCSDQQVLKILSDLKQKYGKQVVTPNINKSLKDRKALLNDFFKVEKVTFFDKHGLEFQANVTNCKYIKEFVEFVCLHRDVDIEDCDHLIGLDEGKGRFTLMYSCISKNPDSLDYKESGVKQSFVLACAEEVPETYENLFQIIQLKEIKAKFVSDLKLQNILLELTSHSSKFPCPYGHCFKNCDGTWSKGNDKSFGEISQYSNKWKVETGGDRKRLKDYFNYEFTPLLPVPPEDLILQNVPPPPLHLVDLGPINIILRSLENLSGDFSDLWRIIGV